MGRAAVIGLLASACIAVNALPSTHVLHEKRDLPLSNAIDRRRIDGDVVLPMRIGLKQNEAALARAEEFIMDVSDPTSANWGKFWTSDEVISTFQPHEDSVNSVLDWLAANGIPDVTHSDNKQWLAFDLPAAKAEQLLKTEYFEHEHSSGHFDASCDEYHLPHYISEHVDYITPGIMIADISGRSDRSREAIIKRGGLGKRGSHLSKQTKPLSTSTMQAIADLETNPNSLANCDKAVTPACIRALYGIPLANPNSKPDPRNFMGLFEEGDLYYQGDLDRFFTKFAGLPNGTAPIFHSVDGGESPPASPKSPGYKLVEGENDLDVQVSIPIVYPQNVSVFQVDDPYYASISGYESHGKQHGYFNTFLDAIDGSYCTYSAYGETGDSPIDPKYPDPRPNGYKGKLMCGTYQAPYILSTSYSAQEIDFPYNYQRRQCNEWMKLALQGTTTFVASGDNGVGPCDTSAGNRVFTPWQISGCPWVTNVGATQIKEGNSPFDPEIASNPKQGQGVSSGGGFSFIFDAPKYQQADIQKYFNGPSAPTYPYFENGQYNNTKGRYNRNGRAYPDIAAVGQNVMISLQDHFILIGGTSAAAPISAALFNRIVEERLAAGKGPIGFINPTLYQNPSLLNDVTVGSNPGCKSPGFKTAPGWDLVTGLGTPSYPKLLKFYMNMP